MRCLALILDKVRSRSSSSRVHFVDVALEEAGYEVKLTLNPAAVRVLWDGACGVLTGNGPQSVDEQAVKLAEIVARRAA